MFSFEKLMERLRCPACRAILFLASEGGRCAACGASYPLTEGRLSFLTRPADTERSVLPSDALVYRLKLWVKRRPWLFTFLNHTLGTYVGVSARQAISALPRGSVILNIGSGAEVIRDDVVNVDIHPYAGVHIVADVQELPFKDESVDAVIAESVLEHLPYPEQAVREMHRMLRSGGLIYLTTPFIIGYHSSPGDYYRWTISGMRELLKEFKEQELGIAVGPTNALTYILREWLATALSFGSGTLFQILILFFIVLFAPLNLLDHVLKHVPSATNIAHLYYFIGTKR